MPDPLPDDSDLSAAGTAAEAGARPDTATETPDPATLDVAGTAPDQHFEIIVEAIRNRDMGRLRDWALSVVKSPDFWIDAGLIVLSIVLALAISRLLLRLAGKGRIPTLASLLRKVPAKQQLSPFRLTLVPVTWALVFIASSASIPCPLLRAYSLILTLFVFLHLPAKFVEGKSWMSLVTSILFVMAALHVLGLLDNVTGAMDSWTIELGSNSLSALDLLKGLLAFSLLLWFSGLLSKFLTGRIGEAQDLSPNVKVLFTKIMRVGFIVLAVLISLGVMGLKITTLAVFGGALGLGLGFGLQKVISNLVSGIILLLDKSIKPGDVIEIEQTYGWVNSLNMRYASVITRDNKEHLIPNEDLITLPVINWSYSSKLVRVKTPIGISYDSDVPLAMEVAQKMAASTDRVVDTPAPRCNLVGFGDSSVDLDLRFWIDDPHNGVGKVRSDVLLKVWNAFHENGIEFPFPQRDVNFKLADRELLGELLRRSGKEKAGSEDSRPDGNPEDNPPDPT